MAQLIYRDEEIDLEVSVTVDSDATAYTFVDVTVARLMAAIGYHPETIDEVLSGEEQNGQG